MKPTDIINKYDVIYDKLKLLAHKAYEMMIFYRNGNDDEEERTWSNHQEFIKDAMMIVDDGRGTDLTKKDFNRMNSMWNQCKHISV